MEGFVGDIDGITSSQEKTIRFLYYREFENWIKRFILPPHLDIDSVKRGQLHQSSSIPEIQHRTSFSNVFTEFHLSVEFSDLFICRLLNFSSQTESQALWSASKKSILRMDWRKGIIDQHGRYDWVYYYGELEFLDVQFCVSSSDSIQGSTSLFTDDFPVQANGITFYSLLKAPRLFYLSLDEGCFQYDPGKSVTIL